MTKRFYLGKSSKKSGLNVLSSRIIRFYIFCSRTDAAHAVPSKTDIFQGGADSLARFAAEVNFNTVKLIVFCDSVIHFFVSYEN